VQCKDKTGRYRDRISAELALSRLKNKRKKPAEELKRTYPCPLCGKWHLTSQEKIIKLN
jgi:hypothetical protein